MFGGPSLIDYIGIISCNAPMTARIQPCLHGGERRSKGVNQIGRLGSLLLVGGVGEGRWTG